MQVPEESIWHGKSVTVAELRWYNQSPVLFLQDVVDRNTAESLIKAILIMDADADELPTEPDAWYDHQLVGLKVLRDGTEVGVVTAVEHFPAQDLLVIKAGDKDVMVPFVKAIVPSVDLKAGTLVVTPPTGLFEEVLPELATPEPADSARANDTQTAVEAAIETTE